MDGSHTHSRASTKQIEAVSRVLAHNPLGIMRGMGRSGDLHR